VDGHGILVDRERVMYRDDDRVPSRWTLMDTFGGGSMSDYHAKTERENMKCKCCKLEVEVNDGANLCHYCYVRDCAISLGKCDNALILCGDHLAPITDCWCLR
jgi:hypothetical protein